MQQYTHYTSHKCKFMAIVKREEQQMGGMI